MDLKRLLFFLHLQSMSSSRKISRIKALQILFAWEFSQPKNLHLIKEIVDLTNEEFTETLISEYLKNEQKIDILIVSKLKNWKLSRLNYIDKNILRLGCLELILKTADKAVILNEYINIAKEFGTENSGGFVNGILDSIYID
jgi:N utilization substance protein B